MAKRRRRKRKKVERIDLATVEQVRVFYDQYKCENLGTGMPARREFNGHLIKPNSLRYRTFFSKGLKCVTCGVEGEFFAVEKNPGDEHPHLNLYAKRNDGSEVLMTKDHIQPKSKGGRDVLKNMQTMCTCCNMAKGSDYETHFTLYEPNKADQITASGQEALRQLTQQTKLIGVNI